MKSKSDSALFTLIHLLGLVGNDLLVLVFPKENKMFAFIIFHPNAITCSASETTFAKPHLKNGILVAALPFSPRGSLLMSAEDLRGWILSSAILLKIPKNTDAPWTYISKEHKFV